MPLRQEAVGPPRGGVSRSVRERPRGEDTAEADERLDSE